MVASTNSESLTIVAQATPIGRGGVGIVRISGPKVLDIAVQILGKVPNPREATHLTFWGQNKEMLDQGIALFFRAPHSFTGEDVLELQGHGGPIVLNRIIQEIVRLGARLAKPGEFSLRAFLNDKMDLVQAEAVADLIDAQSEQAAKSALKSLQGDFSRIIDVWVESLIRLRLYVEAAIDFPEEEIDFLSDARIQRELFGLIQEVAKIKEAAVQGVLLREGVRVVIAGKPNAGKSSLLNCLSGTESAIVTDIPGTTRDVLKEQISIDGLLLQLMDTAGLRDGGDSIEMEGMRRARLEIKEADHILWVVDGTDPSPFSRERVPEGRVRETIVLNKIDLTDQPSGIEHFSGYSLIRLSVKTGEGVSLLKKHLKESVGFLDNGNEGVFNARHRHLLGIEQALTHLDEANVQLTQKAGELVAEELRQAQLSLEEITGKVSSDDLLGRIFSEFCIGK